MLTWLGWRSVFPVNVPVGAAAGLLSLRLVPPHSAPGSSGGQFDLAGAA
jgi:predicted MFS family arabinose efflux permease